MWLTKDMKLDLLAKTLFIAAIGEICTGLILIVYPAIIVLLFRLDVSSLGLILTRCFGIAIFSLGFVYWPRLRQTEASLTPFRGMLLYNAIIASYLFYLAIEHITGLLLLPAAILHALIAILLIWLGLTVRSK